MIEEVIKQTTTFLGGIPKSKRKKIGQFFTSPETARYMASLFEFKRNNEKIRAIDPGAGTGVLSAAFIERIQQIDGVKEVELICYETDKIVLPILKMNLEYLQTHSPKRIKYKMIEDDYLLSQKNDFNQNLFADSDSMQKVDYIIGNPPYLRIPREHPAAAELARVVHGAPNLYFLFASMSLYNLRENGELVYIIPRSWTSGAYFKAFREYFLEEGKLEQVHLFVSRDKVFSQENVLQETIIIKVRKAEKKPHNVLLTSSQSNNDFNSITQIKVPYDSVVVGKEHYVFLPTSEKELSTIKLINKYSSTMPDIGLRMKTGIVVDFRHFDVLKKEHSQGTVPLFYSQHIKNGMVNHDSSGKEYDWMIDSKPGLIQKNKNYVFCKRFTAKEETRRLQCGIYLSKNFSEFDFIGTQNKINFVDKINGDSMTKQETFGIFALLNSNLFDLFYRVLNGSTQVNSTEINNIPVPPLSLIVEMGKKLIAKGILTTEACDKILLEVAYGET